MSQISYNARNNFIETDDFVSGTSSTVVLEKNLTRTIVKMFGDTGFVDATNFTIPLDIQTSLSENPDKFLVFSHNSLYSDSGNKMKIDYDYEVDPSGEFISFELRESLFVEGEDIIEVVSLTSNCTSRTEEIFKFYAHSEVKEITTTILSSGYVNEQDFYNNCILFKLGRFVKPRLEYRVDLSGTYAVLTFTVLVGSSVIFRSQQSDYIEVYQLTKHTSPRRIVNSTGTESRNKEQLYCLPQTSFKAF